MLQQQYTKQAIAQPIQGTEEGIWRSRTRDHTTCAQGTIPPDGMENKTVQEQGQNHPASFWGMFVLWQVSGLYNIVSPQRNCKQTGTCNQENQGNIQFNYWTILQLI
jgi:hypothetical protein